jgi:hypothetical protein
LKTLVLEVFQILKIKNLKFQVFKGLILKFKKYWTDNQKSEEKKPAKQEENQRK